MLISINDGVVNTSPPGLGDCVFPTENTLMETPVPQRDTELSPELFPFVGLMACNRGSSAGSSDPARLDQREI